MVMSRNGELEGRVIPAQDLSAGEIAAWDELCRSLPHLGNPFFSPHYTRAVASVRPHVYVCVLERGGRPAGFLPFQFRTGAHRLLGSGERVGEAMTDYFGLIAEPELRLDEQTLLRLSGLEILNFSHLDEAQLEYGLPGDKPEAGCLMNMECGPEAYWKMLRQEHREFTSNTERRQRTVEREFGALRFTPMESDWSAPLDHLLQYKSKQYAATGRRDLFAVEWIRRLMDTLAASREETCAGIVSTLYAGETWVASHFGLRCLEMLHYWLPVYNPDLSRLGPGRMLLRAFIERSAEMGIRRIDHGLGEARYKQECSNARHTYYRGAWQRSSVRSLLGRAAESARWRIEGMRST